MTWPAVLRPALDVLVPDDPNSARRRVRNAAVWAALAAWLLPAHGSLGTDTTPHRAWICGAFVVVAVLAQLARRGKPWRLLFAAAVVAAAAIVRVFGGWWGVGFAVFSAAVTGLTALRRRLESVGTEPGSVPTPSEVDPLPARPGRGARAAAYYAWLVISIVFMKEWAAQAMVVPTGSMQPTIMGAGGRTSAGDHLLVENFSYLFRDPRRWEIVVFEFPLFRERYFVKRVVGLPGEHLEIKDGDIWVNGRIARKPRIVQETLWQELFPRKGGGGTPKKIVDGFQSSGPWKPLSDTEVQASPAAEATWAQFKLKDACADLRVKFTATRTGEKTAASARITSRGAVVSLETSFYGTELDVGGAGGARWTSPWSGTRVELCVADGEAWAVIDGRESERLALPAERRGKNAVEIGAAGGPVVFRDVRVDADIVYETAGGKAAWDVPKDSFFFLGDNVKNSQDSRYWSAEVFHPPGGAPPVSARISLIDERGGDVPNIRETDGFYEFTDADGLARKLPLAGTTVDHGVPAPYATRGHLIGRAVLTFWPFFTPDAGFRPRLLP